MKIDFYDTCALINADLDEVFKADRVVVSKITWDELNHLKDNKAKTEEVRSKVRKIFFYAYHYSETFEIVKYDFEDDKKSNDERILDTASHYYYKLPEEDEFRFYTDDLYLFRLAEFLNVPVSLTLDYEPPKEVYKGFKEYFLNAEEMDDFCEKRDIYAGITSNLLINEYLIIKFKDEHNNDCELLYKKTEDGLEELPDVKFMSTLLGEIKPRDCYQKCLMDSLNTNQFTLITGPAGAGKSLLGLASLLYKLEYHEIDKIYMLFNPVAANGAARLGFYKGTRDEKLLDSQPGGFLQSKLGDTCEAVRLMNSAPPKLELIPFSDVRGLDLSGKCALFITEAQNLDCALMQLAIQRAGDDTIVVIEGDPKAQLDMKQYEGNNNGMLAAIEAFKGEDCAGIVELQKIHRSKLAEIAERIGSRNYKSANEFNKRIRG